jgi:hypothetical protein
MRHHAANIGDRRVYLAAKRKFPQAALRTGSFVPFTMKRGSSTDSAHAPKIELSR